MKFNFGLYDMFQRKILSELQDLANQYPVVTVVGPRQSGKTTLAACFSKQALCELRRT